MQTKKIMAGALGALMVFSTVGFAATLADYPQPFVSAAGTADFLVVVGADAAPSDVVGAIDVAANLGGLTGVEVPVDGDGGSTITGEGAEVGTSNTPIFLGQSLGKIGARTTMTKTELPTLLADGSFEDSDASTTHKYTQFIHLTPSSTTDVNYIVQFDKPGSNSQVDPTYNFGRMPTSPSGNNYWYRTQVIFDKDVAANTSIGESITIFGSKYTITSGTDFTLSSPKLVVSGSAETIILNGQETTTVTINGVTYEITLEGVTSTPKALVRVESPTSTDSKEVAVSSQATIAGLEVFVDRATQLSSTDQTVNSAKLLLGAQKLTLQHGSKVKTGTNEDNVDGTFVNMTTTGGKLSSFQVHFAGTNSNEDFLSLGGSYMNSVWKSFSIDFPTVTPALDSSDRTTLYVAPSGDNIMQVRFTNNNNVEKTFDWAFKPSSTATNFSLSDNGGDSIHTSENETIAQNEYFVVDSGEFTHLYELSSASIDGTTSSNVEVRDVFTGTTTKITLGTDDDNDNVVLDGQRYYFGNNSDTTVSDVKVTWGTNAALRNPGTFLTIWPTLKGKNSEFIALTRNVTIGNTTITWQLPTGAVSLSGSLAANTFNVTFAAATKEDGTSSACTGCGTVNLLSAGSSNAFRLGRTSTGGAVYNVTVNAVGSFNVNLVTDQGGNNNASVAQPGVLLVEEKDDNNDASVVWIGASTEASGSNNVAIPGTPTFSLMTGSASGTGATGVASGTDSTVTWYVDFYGSYVKRTTSGQDTLTLWYPNDQTKMNIFVTAEDAVISTGGSTGGTVFDAIPITTSVAKLDTEVTQADRTTKNLILVGGPAVNDLVTELATQGKTYATSWYVTEGQGTALIDWVADAFTTGKSALVVAGHSAADTRTVTSILQNFEDHESEFTGETRVVYKNGVISTTTA